MGSRELETIQAERAGRSAIAPVPLIQLTTYTNRAAKTVKKIFYFSTLPVLYDYGGTGTDQMFLPVVVGGSDFFSGLDHLTDPHRLVPFDQSFNLQLHNLTINGYPLWYYLTSFANLEGASIQISQLLVEPYDKTPLDLSSYAGTEHTVFFRGRVNRIGPIDEFFFTMECSTELPSLADSWIYAADENAVTPVDIGKRLPRAYGEAVRVPIVTWQTGVTGTLLTELDNTETGVAKNVADYSELPSGEDSAGFDFYLLIDTEIIACYKRHFAITENELWVRSRAQLGTTAAAHSVGSQYRLIRGSERWVVSDYPSESIGDIYAHSAISGFISRIDEEFTHINKFTKDRETIPGRTVSSIDFITEGTLTQQPLTVGGTNGINGMDRNYQTGDSTYVSTSGGTAIAVGFDNFGSFTRQKVRVAVTKGGGDQDVDIKVATAIIGTIPASSIPSSGSTPAIFEFVTVSELTNTINVDPVSTGGVRLHNIEREISRESIREDQTADSASTNISGEDADKVIDGDPGTFVQFTSTDNEFVEAVFPAPGYSYDAQQIRIRAKIRTADSWELRVDGVAGKTGSMNSEPFSPVVYEFETDKIGNAIRVYTNTPFNWGKCYEIERTLIRSVADSLPIEGQILYADADGVPSPGSPVEVWETAEDMDAGTWSVLNCSVAADTSEAWEGIASQKITITEPAVVIPTDVLTNWAGSNCTVTNQTDQGHTDGTGCIRADSTSTTTDALLIWQDAASAFDLSNTGAGVGIWTFDFKIQKKDLWSGHIEIYVGNSGSATYIWDFDSIDFEEDTWYTIQLDITDAHRQVGDPDDTDIDYFVILYNTYNQQTGGFVFVDNIRVYRPRTVVIQNNAIPGADFDGVAAEYRVALRAEGGALLRSVNPSVYISDETGSGTTKTTDYRKLTFPPVMLPTWQEITADSYADVGDTTLSIIDTIRFELEIPGSRGFGKEISPRFGPMTVWVDNLEVPETLGTAYQAAKGVAMTHPADIIRHWIEEVGGEIIDLTSYAAFATALGAAAKWGVDVRALGFQWEEVLQRMAFEARCNVVAVETTAGRKWKLLSADNDYGFGSPTDQLTQLDGARDQGRRITDLASYFTFRYGYDATKDATGSEEGFTRILIANPAVSDVPITTALIAAAAKSFGPLDSGPITFRCIQDKATAQDLAGYLVQEKTANNRRIFVLPEVAWFEALEYDVGDTVKIAPRWSLTTYRCRITIMTKEFEANVWSITAVEISQNGTRT